MDKMRYMISDAAALVNVESHVLRYWEEELELSVPRNEMGHRYYTKENIQQFRMIKNLKEQGYQLKVIKMAIQNGIDPEEASQRVQKEMVTVEEKKPKTTSNSEVKMQQFQMIMSKLIREAIEDNNATLGKCIGENVGERVLKEMNYLMREQDEQEEIRYKKLDAAIREVHSKKRKAKKEKKRIFSKKEALSV